MANTKSYLGTGDVAKTSKLFSESVVVDVIIEVLDVQVHTLKTIASLLSIDKMETLCEE